MSLDFIGHVQLTPVFILGTTIERLLLWKDPRNPPSTVQIDEMTDRVVQSTLEYAVHDAIPLFPQEEGDSTSSLSSRSHHNLAWDIRHLYLKAYHSGVMHPLLMETFAKGICFPRHFLEDPDKECCVRSMGRSLREMIWKIFAAGGGIPSGIDPCSEPEESEDWEGNQEVRRSYAYYRYEPNCLQGCLRR